jgi:PAT family beta-lactamase induction signal transducer AmpG
VNRWRRSLAAYTDRRVLLILPLGFASGLPLLLTASTLSAWLATAGTGRAAIGAFALVGTPYALKFLWAPVIDRLPPPLRGGRRRGWGIAIQIALISTTLALGSCDPKRDLPLMGMLALLVAGCRRPDHCRSCGMVRRLCHDGGAARGWNAGIPARPGTRNRGQGRA